MKVGYSIKCELEDAIYELIGEMCGLVWADRTKPKGKASDMHADLFAKLHLGQLIRTE